MKGPALSSLRGVVTVSVSGPRVEELINALGEAGIPLWGVKPEPEGVRLHLLLPDFYALRPLLKRTGCRMRIRGRTGLPFRLARLWKRKFFVAGAVCFAVLLVLLSSMVWTVRVSGNERIASEDILEAAKLEGIRPYQWIWRLETPDKLSKALTLRLPGVSWVGVERQGTAVNIQVVESAEPEKQELYSPRHLVSRSDAVITEIIAEQGRPAVSRNTRVKKGDILISGILGDEENSELVVAKGEVRGLVWHEYNIAVPLEAVSGTYTGERKDRYYLVLGNWAVQLWGYGKSGYAETRLLEELRPLTWRGQPLPLGWMTEKELEVRESRRTRTPEEARNEGIRLAKADLLTRYGTDSAVKSQKILHEKKENGKVYMKVLFEVEERIAQELPIVYNQGE
ncbi:sporulation protein YqfD [Paenibacillus sp. CN-4]|uniref:sporulation protein YqfD n=1 Tax=Paenibacillus nanchangensis TaxID=3348343 RepID=UPI00397A985B